MTLIIELVPDLSYCIETVARREHEKTVKELLVADVPDEILTEKAEALRLFLEGADLRKLRAESEKHLIEGRKVKFTISIEEGEIQYQMKVL